ncbi:hypothetical protein [Sphingomonas sp. R86521]|uniref:hypothetical protein n=1 Tax=Sphingomonas sp. R86521 TaxID=3093860 RepID=UPI0036D33E35
MAFCAPVPAQVPTYPPPNTAALAEQATAAQAKADAAQAKADAAQVRADAAIASIPVRATTLPPAERTSPTLGSSMQYRGADDPQPRITRTASCTLMITAGIGSCDALWDGSPFASGVVVRLAGSPAVVTTSVGAANEQPMTCKACALSTTSISFRCWQAQSSALTLGIVSAGVSVLPFSAPAATATVMVTALPSS